MLLIILSAKIYLFLIQSSFEKKVSKVIEIFKIPFPIIMLKTILKFSDFEF